MSKLLVFVLGLLFCCLPFSVHASDFVGTWVGKWDNTYCVQFTVTADKNTGDISVLYEWEENVGQPLRKQRYSGVLTGRSLKVGHLIEIFASLEEPEQAVALGHFSTPRAAVLIREPTKRCSPDGSAR
jgi:hypothetical protein